MTGPRHHSGRCNEPGGDVIPHPSSFFLFHCFYPLIMPFWSFVSVKAFEIIPDCSLFQNSPLNCDNDFTSTLHFKLESLITIILMPYSLLRPKVYQPTAGLTSTCLQTGVKDHPTSLGVACGQYDESPSLCWFSRTALWLQISTYPIHHDAQLAPVHFAGYQTRDSCIRASDCLCAIAKERIIPIDLNLIMIIK